MYVHAWVVFVGEATECIFEKRYFVHLELNHPFLREILSRILAQAGWQSESLR